MIHACHKDTLNLPKIKGTFGYTPQYDVEFIAFWASVTGGNYLEIGCNNGFTLKSVAEQCPGKACIGLDWSSNSEIWDTQNTEVPPAVGSAALHLKNVRIYDEDALTIDIWDFNYGCVFLDAEHSYNWQVKMFQKLWNENNYRDWILIVHDVPQPFKGSSITHIETKAFLEYVSLMFPVIYWHGTNCATVFVSRRGSEKSVR